MNHLGVQDNPNLSKKTRNCLGETRISDRNGYVERLCLCLAWIRVDGCILEKDVNSSNVSGIANETSWTSWALTSLSSNIGKLTTKPQQPSVNLTLAKSDSQTTLASTSTMAASVKGLLINDS